ncbi:hypothetical protein SDC9_171137 [bioreactor metagenome]|uniref:Uncharacterized protein n=1 Tax=bioreactor metagenome TaxID=1076179 RepID=A0A645GIM8_9ZZZZ
MYCVNSVFDDDVRGLRIAHSGKYIVYNIPRLLGAWIIRRDYDEIGQGRGQRAHFRTFGFIPVSAAAEKRHYAPFRKAAHRREHVFYCVRRVCVVDEHGIVSAGRDDLHAALDVRRRAERLCALFKRNVESQRRAEHAERVIDHEAAWDGDIYADALLMCHSVEFNM